jgi:hypothetical protein
LRFCVFLSSFFAGTAGKRASCDPGGVSLAGKMELGEDKPTLSEPERKPPGVLRYSLLPPDHHDWPREIELPPFHLIAPMPLPPCLLPRQIMDRAIDVVQLARDLRFLTKDINGFLFSFIC